MVAGHRGLIGFCIALSVSIPAVARPQYSSAYTTHDYSKCRKVASDGVIETRVCPGYAGVPVKWISEPDGTSVAFGSAGSPDGIYQDFAFAGTKVEWRGPVVGGRIAPVAAIIQVDISRGISGPTVRSLLVVFKLEGRRSSCIAAVVNGASTDANATARKAADGVSSFRCGKDARAEL